jgi:hypothetical protein
MTRTPGTLSTDPYMIGQAPLRSRQKSSSELFCWIRRHLKIDDILKKEVVVYWILSPLFLRWGPRLTLYFMGEGYGLILGRFGGSGVWPS